MKPTQQSHVLDRFAVITLRPDRLPQKGFNNLPALFRGNDRESALMKARGAETHCIFVYLANLFSYELLTYIRGRIFFRGQP